MNLLYPHLSVNQAGHLAIGGADTLELARAYGTPLYVMDEDAVRRMCRIYRQAAAEAFGQDALPLYASKALCCAHMYRIAAEEGMGVDCVSGGELYTARRAGFPASRIYFHGNNKTDRDIRDALEMGVGTFVADNREELDALERLAADAGRVQSILLRITPGIDPHTHKAISTGRVDSKFGSAIETGQALDITRYALGLPHITLRGFHCHIGSQIFDRYPFVDAARIMIDFMASVRTATGFIAHELNLGGGLGVPYTEYDRTVDYAAVIRDTGNEMRAICRERDFPLPHVILEPGRSLVAAAGITLYTVGSVKTIPGFRTYVSVDGGMPDNPRYALYQSQYTALIANRPDAEQSWRVTLAGRCCESGDLIGENLPLQPTARGDILAVLTTGAYNYSMASNYNRLPRPALVMIRDGEPFVAVRRETYEDVVRNDVF